MTDKNFFDDANQNQPKAAPTTLSDDHQPSGQPTDVKTLSIIIPAYNEARTINNILEKVGQVSLIGNTAKEVIIVNDCSTDDTEQVVQSFIEQQPEAMRLISHPVNQGKGAAIHTGIQHATGDYIVVQDADLEYDPHEFNVLLKPILTGNADVVYGSRFMGG